MEINVVYLLWAIGPFLLSIWSGYWMFDNKMSGFVILIVTGTMMLFIIVSHNKQGWFDFWICQWVGFMTGNLLGYSANCCHPKKETDLK